MKNYYDILEIKKDASQEDIKRAYRDLMKQYHPDVAKDKKVAEDKCKEINVAYETLSDPAKRQAYDNPRPRFHGGHPFGGFGGSSFGAEAEMNEVINRFFRSAGGFQFHFGGGNNMGDTFFSSTQIVNCEHNVSIGQAILGGEIDINSPIGKVHIKLPPYTQPGSTLKIQVRKEGNVTVMLHVKINVIIPSNLTEEQKKKISELGI